MNIVFPYPTWYIVFCLLLAGGFTVLLYRKDRKLIELSKTWIGLLSVLRFIAIALLSLLLLSPLIKHFNRSIEEPIIILAEDNSQSMRMGSSGEATVEPISIEQLKEELATNYQVDHYLFDEELREKETETDFNGLMTNYEQLFEGIESRYVNRNVAAVVLYSDGLYNRGANPLYMSKGADYPIYAIAAGDTNRYKDARIKKIRNNKIAFLGNEFPVEIDLNVDQGKGSRLLLTILKENEAVHKDTINVQSNDEFLTVNAKLKAEALGVQEYIVELGGLEDERNLENNRQRFYVDVIDGRQRILILSNAPHPDLGALRRSIAKSDNYTLDQAYFNNYEQEDFPYDLILLQHNQKKTTKEENAIIGKLLKTDIPLMILGPRWPSLDVAFGFSSKKAVSEQKNEAQALLNQEFSLFTISDELKESLKNYPPLKVPLNLPLNLNANTILLHQKIGNVSTKYPLIAFKEKNQRKIGRLFGEGIWRWSMADYKINGNQISFNELIRKSIQYLVLKSDRSFFRLNYAKEYFERDEVQFEAQLFNPSYELVNTSEINLILTDENGKDFTYSFSPQGRSYRLKVGTLKEGSYTFTAKADLQGKSFEEKGQFIVKKLALEQLTQRANHNLLYQLAEQSGGDFYSLDEMGSIVSDIQQRSDVQSEAIITEEIDEVVEFEWIFFLLMALVSMEWFIRKYKGAY